MPRDFRPPETPDRPAPVRSRPPRADKPGCSLGRPNEIEAPEPAALSLSFYPAAPLFDLEPSEPDACRVCGCTEWHTCTDPDGMSCWWVEPGLCSQCAPESQVEVILCGRPPRDPETQQALAEIIQAAARLLVKQTSKGGARAV